MCGIAGIFNLRDNAIDHSLLEAMSSSIHHRGPDDLGFYVNDSIGLAHRRLAIIDLSEAGHQPMSSLDKKIWIVFNGEIYNYLELKQQLKEKGHIFKTETDTEVILAAYQEYGDNCVNLFNGMWAFAIWDERKKKLFCSRDRFGVKPFYYTLSNGVFYFASELKAFCTLKNINLSVSDESVFLYLSRRLTNYKQNTFFKDVYQLEAAHSLEISSENKKIWRYWDIDPNNIIHSKKQEDVIHEFHELFKDSIRLRMRSDVPIGTCLSGGLDSSSIVCMTNSLLKENLSTVYQQETFSACFDQKNIDERPFMEHVISATGANRNFVFPNEDSLVQDLDKLIYHQDEPFISLSIFAQWMVMKTAKEKGVTVLLDGQGADELLAGYGYHSLYWAQLLRNKGWKSLQIEVSPELRTEPLRTLKRFGRMLYPQQIRNWERRTQFKPYMDYDFFKYHSELKLEHYSQPFNRVLKDELYNLLNYSLSQLLRYEDRNSMAFSLEARVPFLDYRLAQFIFSLPESYLINEGWSKWILRKSMEGILPPEVQWRKGKIGFEVPQQLWLQKTLTTFVRNIFHDHRFHKRNYWNGQKVIDAYENWVKGKDNDIAPWIWSIINMELWLRRFIDK